MSRVAEKAVVFGDHARLVGVYAPVEGNAVGPAVLFLNAGLLHHVGPQRMHVQFARMFASMGVPSLRFDCSGIGDSGTRQDHLPFAESCVAETQEAMDALAEWSGVERFILFGLCSGADQAFQTALADDRVEGVVLLDPYPYETIGFRVARVARPLSKPRTWKKAATGQYRLLYKTLQRLAGEHEPTQDETLVVRDIPPREQAELGYHSLLARGACVYVVFTAGQLGTYNHKRQFWDMHPTLPRDNPALRYTYFPQADHTFTALGVRELLRQHVSRWYVDRFGA